MRLWSIHPKYLDKIGLVALWREALLAQKVLEGRTKAFKKHPQLRRFRASKSPLSSIRNYLLEIYREGKRRGYDFRKEKIKGEPKAKRKIKVTSGQLKYEFEHLMRKLKKRAPEIYGKIKEIRKVTGNPAFRIVRGDIESWEKKS